MRPATDAQSSIGREEINVLWYERDLRQMNGPSLVRASGQQRGLNRSHGNKETVSEPSAERGLRSHNMWGACRLGSLTSTDHTMKGRSM